METMTLTLVLNFLITSTDFNPWAATPEFLKENMQTSADIRCREENPLFHALRVSGYSELMSRRPGLVHLEATFSCAEEFTVSTMCGAWMGCYELDEMNLDRKAFTECQKKGFTDVKRIAEFSSRGYPEMQSTYLCGKGKIYEDDI